MQTILRWNAPSNRVPLANYILFNMRLPFNSQIQQLDFRNRGIGDKLALDWNSIYSGYPLSYENFNHTRMNRSSLNLSNDTYREQKSSFHLKQGMDIITVLSSLLRYHSFHSSRWRRHHFVDYLQRISFRTGRFMSPKCSLSIILCIFQVLFNSFAQGRQRHIHS